MRRRPELPSVEERREAALEALKFEECGQTARSNHWTNTDLLPDIKVNTGANLRIVELVQEGYVQLQP